MSDVIHHAVEAMRAKVKGPFDSSAKFVIRDHGAIMLDSEGVRAGDEPADVTLTASVDTFRAIMDGDLAPMAAFMTGKLQVEGNMGTAMKLGAVLG